MHPASCGRPRTSANEDSSQIRRPRADRLSNRSSDRIGAIRATAAWSRNVRLIWDCDMEPACHTEIHCAEKKIVPW